MNVSVVSAAIVEGNLVLGLSDGSIINCGFVQGPQGLKGDPGPMGATGAPGDDGNTIITIAGIPGNEIGKDGDYAINNRDWFIFGPKSGGIWGKGKSMLPQAKDMVVNGRGTEGSGTGGGSMGGGGAGSGGDGSGLVFTSTVIASGSGRLAQSGTGTTAIVNYPGSPLGMISPESGMAVQSNINAFFVRALEELEVNIPVVIDENRPQVGVYQGMLWFDASEDDYTLYIYDGNEWVPAAPPVSLEGIEQSITGLASAIDELKTITTRQGTDIADAQSTLYGFATALQQQGNQIIELEEEIESIAPSLDRGKWNLAALGAGVTLASGEYAMGIGVDSVYCQEKYLECLAAAGQDEVAKTECNRLMGECETAKDAGEEYFINDWSHATFLHFHKTDSEGKEHTFADYKVGMFIDLFDQGDTGFAVFEITAEPELDGDVYTIGVTPIQHEGEASGLARVKVFSLSGADPTEFVRKTGSTMSGALNVIVESGNAAYIKSGSTDTASVFYVRNGDSKTLFRVKGTGNVQAGPDEDNPFIATDANDVTTKKFVDDAINAALTAPARFEWKVFVNLDGTPQQGLAYLNGASMSDTTVIRVHKQALNASVPIKGHSAGLTMFKYSPSPKLYYSTILSAWSYSSSGWQWKGTAEVEEVKLFADYIQIKLGSHRWANMNFSNTGDYRFTVGGLF